MVRRRGGGPRSGSRLLAYRTVNDPRKPREIRLGAFHIGIAAAFAARLPSVRIGALPDSRTHPRQPGRFAATASADGFRGRRRDFTGQVVEAVMVPTGAEPGHRHGGEASRPSGPRGNCGMSKRKGPTPA